MNDPTPLTAPTAEAIATEALRAEATAAGRPDPIDTRPEPPRNRRRAQALLLALLLALVNVVVWRGLHPPGAAAEYGGTIAGLCYNAFQRWDNPLEQRYPTAKEIETDLQLLSKQTRRIRTYSSAEFPDLPKIAAEYGLRITAGVWLDQNEVNNRREIEAIKAATRRRGPIERVIAGNEQVLTGNLTPEEMISYLDEIRASVKVPVSTAEPWHVWLRYPELVKHVDFITVHLLPYWEGLPEDMALNYSFDRLEQVRKAFPNKHILIGEIGWPSQGDRFDGAKTSPEIQARFIRDFLARTQGKHLDYFIMEAIDQPWKTANEGRVGAYWGIYHADRTPKFDFSGPVQSDANWMTKAVVASIVAFFPMAWFLATFWRQRLGSRLLFCVFIQAIASLVVWLFALPLDYYLRPVDWTALIVLAPTLLMMAAILLANGFEFSEMLIKGNLRRVFPPRPLRPGEAQPFASIHLACCNEQPEMVIATIESLRRLDYENFEVLVIDNNTKDDALWKPVEKYMAGLPANFRFFHLPKWPGYKAGALNFALEQTDPRAEIVGVVDADYVAKRDWLSTAVAYFQDPTVGVVQAPQAHRGWNVHVFRQMMNWEYDGFFRIGMHHRNERDAIIQHGTMTLIKADPLMNQGKWSEWTICEDAELGLRLMKAGYKTVYIDRIQGEGLTPDDFGAFKRQRKRWAQGAMQILKHHWGTLVRGGGSLTPGQRYHFLTGWLSWFGDALHLVFAFGAMLWTIGIVAAPWIFSLPIMLFMLPLFGFFACKAAFGPILYSQRVKCSFMDILGAAVAGMGLSHAIAIGVFAGLTQKRSVFEVTTKGTGKGPMAATPTADPLVAAVSAEGGAQLVVDPVASPELTAPTAPVASPAEAPPKKKGPSVFSSVREEAFLLAGLSMCVLAMFISRKANHIESALWMWILVLQAIPYAAALLCAWLSSLPERQSAPAPAGEGASGGPVGAA